MHILTFHLCKCSSCICANDNDTFAQIVMFHLCKCTSSICLNVQVAFVQMFSHCICANSLVAFVQILTFHLCKCSHSFSANVYFKRKNKSIAPWNFFSSPDCVQIFLDPTHLWHHLYRRSNHKRVGIFKNRAKETFCFFRKFESSYICWKVVTRQIQSYYRGFVVF